MPETILFPFFSFDRLFGKLPSVFSRIFRLFGLSPLWGPRPSHIPSLSSSRNFSSEKYILPSDEEERTRLIMQHRLLKRTYNDTLILAPVSFHPGDKILECGAGSGIWCLDVAKALPPAVSVHGLDIASRIFPLSHPSNVSFSLGSVTGLPRKWENSFTLVHQRLLLAGLQRPDWLKAIKEMHRVLAPGGWVQLGEVGAWKAGEATAKHFALCEALFRSKGLVLDVADHLPKWLADAGFVNIHVERRSIPLGKWGGQDGVDARDNWIEVFQGMKTPTLNSGGMGFVKSEEEFDQLVAEVEKDWDNTPGAEMPFLIFYGQKPEI